MSDSFIVCGKNCPEGYLHVVYCKGKYYLMLYDTSNEFGVGDNVTWFDSNLLTSVLAFAFERFKVRF